MDYADPIGVGTWGRHGADEHATNGKGILMHTPRYLRTLLIFGVLFCAALGSAHACGRERWSAKVLADGTALFTTIASADVNYLRSLPRPNGIEGFDAPRVPDERRLYRIQGELLGFKVEDDGDIHVVIAENGNRDTTLVAEIPDPRCMSGAPGAYIRNVAQTRLAFVKRYGIPPYRSMRLAYSPITIIGPVFFDFEHGQMGSAPNDAEVHPVLALGDDVQSVPRAGPARAVRAVHTSIASETAAPSCPGDTVVWVNTRSGVYHLPRTRYYGSTSRGVYMCRRDADSQGYRPARNE